ncbi:hypothetical protein [uncultured Stenotrophomonas sp.]|uniref:hypothetical protein n=1 Tax=uncultured Stenotrophomonas sp. TaxID=165438 RepID=UPI0025FD0972|nr:hypothetical protein [uncultured Stenotrophomonas sp.]
MERTKKTLTMADVAGWGSALVMFGLIQGGFYLKAYWGHFGLDPLIGVALTGTCAIAVRLSPTLPAAVKGSPWLVYVLVVLVYVPISSSWLGFERARAITSGSSNYTTNVTIDKGVQAA